MKIGGHNGFMPYMSVAKGIAASLTGPSETAVRDCTYSRCLRHVSWSWQYCSTYDYDKTPLAVGNSSIA